MLQFAAPLGLLALGALVVPIVLHLVRRPTQVVRVGSLKFLEAAPRRVRSLRWRDLLLLALRCLFLALLATLLAGPRWQPAVPEPVRWRVLAPRASLDATARSAWDDLGAQGYDSRQLAVNFPLLSGTSAAMPTPASHADAWSLLRELDVRLPANSRVAVFGPTSSNYFTGTRPLLTRIIVSWHATAEHPAAPNAAQTPVRFILLAAPDRAEDARYLRAALRAVGAVETNEQPATWVFCLGDVPLPSVPTGATLITDAPASARATEVTHNFAAGSSGPVSLRQRTALSAGVALLRDSAGEPLLVETILSSGARHWRFAFRFHSEWTDWPHRSAFPVWWQQQLGLALRPAHALALEQASPVSATPSLVAPPLLTDFGVVDLRVTLWILAALVFLAERLLSPSLPGRRMS